MPFAREKSRSDFADNNEPAKKIDDEDDEEDEIILVGTTFLIPNVTTDDSFSDLSNRRHHRPHSERRSKDHFLFILLVVLIGGLLPFHIIAVKSATRGRLKSSQTGNNDAQARQEHIMTEHYQQVVDEVVDLMYQGCPCDNIDTLKARPRLTHQMLHVVAQFHQPTHPAAQYQVKRALTQNLLHPAVAAVHILPEKMDDFHVAQEIASQVNATNKLVLGTPLLRQMNYSDAILYANTALHGKYVSIQNSDIWLDAAFDDANLFEIFLDRHHTGIALARHEDERCEKFPSDQDGTDAQPTQNMCFESKSSKDAFLFKSPMHLRMDYINFSPNQPGAENVLLSEIMVEKEWQMHNPCARYRIYRVNCNGDLIDQEEGQSEANITKAQHINQGAYPPATYKRSVGLGRHCDVRNSTQEGPHLSTSS